MGKTVIPGATADVAEAIARMDYEAGRAEAAERVKHQIDFAGKGLGLLTLVNGGALVALFTLVGSKPQIAIRMDLLWVAFACFASGLVFTSLAYFGAFASQGQYYAVAEQTVWNDQRKIFGLPATVDSSKALRLGLIAERLGVGFAAMALLAFVAGSGFALAGVAPT